MNDLDKIIHAKYKFLDINYNRSYLSKYGIDIFVAFFIILIFSILYFYYIIKNIFTNKYNKLLTTCNPINLPFMNLLFYKNNNTLLNNSSNNFDYCVKKSLKQTVKKSIIPQYKALNIIEKTYNNIDKSIMGISSVMNNVRNNVTNNTINQYTKINDFKYNKEVSNTKTYNKLNTLLNTTNNSNTISNDLNNSLINYSNNNKPINIGDKPSWTNL